LIVLFYLFISASHVARSLTHTQNKQFVLKCTTANIQQYSIYSKAGFTLSELFALFISFVNLDCIIQKVKT